MSPDLTTHGGRFEPEYPPYGHSDHLPMAWLAMDGLGATAARRQRFADAYLPRLAPWPADSPRPARIAELLAEIRDAGLTTVLARQLPGLISGWYREAYHPLIRLGYALDFDVPEEAAAALAYFEACGPSPQLERLADAARTWTDDNEDSGIDLLDRAAALTIDLDPEQSFGARAEQIVAREELAGFALLFPDHFASLSQAGLAAFAATHDFFALHLVTASHAFRLLRPYAGPRADALFTLGLVVGYLVIGAPPVPRLRPPRPAALDRSTLLALCRDDEHDLKLAYSAWRQSAHFADPRYLQVAADYLS